MTEKLNPNILTLLRILLLPLPCALLFFDSFPARLTSLIMLTLLALTDYLDGVLARKYQKVSSLGAILDPIADKIFISSIYLTLVYLNYISYLPVFFIILRELLVSYLRAWFPEETKVQRIAKVKTMLQMSFAALVIILNTFYKNFAFLINYLLWFLVFFSYLSALTYFYKVALTVKKFKTNLKYFFYSFFSLFYPVSLLLIFPLSHQLFWINILALSFFFFKKGLAKSSPKLAHKEPWGSLFVIFCIFLEFWYFHKIYFSLWGLLFFSFFTDGIRSLKLIWKILKVQ
jgi:CDP-diacylglycerol--glycerol-3-phosphate 3-phosphatidyltransferase